MRRWGCTLIGFALLWLLAPAAGDAAALPPIKHVFIVVLENKDMTTSFGTGSKAPYLAHTLRARGAFVPGYFGTGHSIIDNESHCAAHVHPLTALPAALAAGASTPNYVFITPNLCNDGHDTNCKNGDPGGLVSINSFLQKWVPKITSSPAFKSDGLLI